MRYYAARKRASQDRWDWTVEHGKIISPSGPCVLHGDGHATKEEAERHFYDWDIQTLAVYVENEHNVFHPCDAPGCNTQTDKGMATKIRFRPQWLCDLHRVKDIYMMLNPFRQGIQISQS